MLRMLTSVSGPECPTLVDNNGGTFAAPAVTFGGRINVQLNGPGNPFGSVGAGAQVTVNVPATGIELSDAVYLSILSPALGASFPELVFTVVVLDPDLLGLVVLNTGAAPADLDPQSFLVSVLVVKAATIDQTVTLP